MLTKWTRRDCVHLEQRWTLPGKLRSFPKAERRRSHLRGSGAALRTSGGSSKRRSSMEWQGSAGSRVERRPGVRLAAAYLAGRLGDPKAGMKLLLRVSGGVPTPLPIERSSIGLAKLQPSTMQSLKPGQPAFTI